MVTKREVKKAVRKSKEQPAMDTTIIEHMACLEVNNLILQPPFRLISNIQWNDKGISFDGSIDVYSDRKINKSNVIGEVKVQVKGTTTYKKVSKKEKIKHPVKKDDLEVYYKFGVGVLYFVVTINPNTHEKQAYYSILAPLDLKRLLLELNNKGNESITLSFKKLEKGYLESICKTVIEVVKKQPQLYIEAKEEMEFTRYKVDFVDIKKEFFNLFEETAYIYGVTADNLSVPLESTRLSEIKMGDTERLCIGNTEEEFNYDITDTKEEFKVEIESTLTITVDKEKKSGRFHLGKLKTLGSYIKCLKLINHYMEYKELPFSAFQLGGGVNKEKKFENIKEEIVSYGELLEVCSEIGINKDYVFNDNEDLVSLFNGIIKVFKHKQYDMLNIKDSGELEGVRLYNIELSDYVKVKLLYTGEKFINFYSKEALETIGGLLPKTTVPKDNVQGKALSNGIPDNWEDYYQRVSIYSNQKIEEMENDSNFDFETLKISFSDKYHDMKVEGTINISLDYMNYYNKTKDEKYLELAQKLNMEHLEKALEKDVPKINIYLIKLMRGEKLTEEEQDNILDIQERAEMEDKNQLRFATEVLLENKVRAKRIFNSLEKEEQEGMLDYPIYHYYNKLQLT